MSERSEQLNPGPRPPAPGPVSPRPQPPTPNPALGLTPGPFLLTGGGTGGHVIPALAVARELRRRGHEVFFVGTDRGMESKLVDGSEGRVVVARVPVVKSGTYSGGVRDIPLGDYAATAKLVDKSGKELRPLRVSLSKGKTSADYKGYAVDWKPSVDVAFDTPYDRPVHYLGAKAQKVYVGR